MIQNNQYKKLAICLYLVGMLNACIKKEDIKSPSSFSKISISQNQSTVSKQFCDPKDPLLEKKSVEQVITVQQVKQIEAKHADLAIPMNAVPMPAHCVCNNENSGQLKLAYRCSETPQAIAAFYYQTMEGWQEIARFEGDEYLIHYQRPENWCSIAIRQINSKHDPNLIVYLAPSKEINS